MATSSSFWCHSCHRIVRISSLSHLLCPFCSGDFVEEINGLASHPTAALFLSADFSPRARSGRGEGFRRHFQRRRSPDLRTREILSLLSSQTGRLGLHSESGESRAWHRDDETGLDIVDRLQSVFSRRGARSEAVTAAGRDGFELGLGTGPRDGESGFDIVDRLQSFFSRRGGRSSMGAAAANDGLGLGLGLGLGQRSGSRRLVDVRDFLLGPGGDLLIQQLIEGGDTERHGSSPASKAAVEAMPTLTITKQSLEADDIHCAVCKEIFEIGGEARKMPCSHVYHSDCILPWLAMHSSCPICRYEMPSEDLPESQSQRLGENSLVIRSRAGGGAGGGGERGLAMVGIPGIGIHVRSFLLFGIGTNDDATAENQTSTAETQAQTPNPQPNSESRASDSMHSDQSLPSTSCNDEIHPLTVEADVANHAPLSVSNINSDSFDCSNMQSATLSDARNTQSGSDSQVAGRRRGRSFMSWLLQSSNSSGARSNEALRSNSTRRRRFWF